MAEQDADDRIYDLDVETLSGDLRDALLTHLRDMKVGWSFLPEREQHDRIYAATIAATNLVRQTINLVQRFNFPTLQVEVGAVKIDKGLEIKLGALSTVANITALAEHGKARAVLVLVDPEIFIAERAPAEVNADQSSLLDDEAA
jgi:hypothetical protein